MNKMQYEEDILKMLKDAYGIEELINENGHTVPQLLLSNGELNPTELVWVQAKQHTTSFNKNDGGRKC
jgi:hypothetical protein